MNKIDSFTGEYYFLSNFYMAPVEYDGIRFTNNEAAFQAQKCDNRKQFENLGPSEAKRLGRNVRLRKDWESVKRSVMFEIVQAKFMQNPDLAEKLLATGDAYLEEGNNWGDRVWGTVYGMGNNWLGHILMEVRNMLKTRKEDIDLNLMDRHVDRMDLIDNAAHNYLTELMALDHNLEWNSFECRNSFECIRSLNEFAVDMLAKKGFRIIYPAVITETDDTQYYEEIHKPDPVRELVILERSNGFIGGYVKTDDGYKPMFNTQAALVTALKEYVDKGYRLKIFDVFHEDEGEKYIRKHT